MQTIGQHVRPALAVDFRDREPVGWYSEQRNRYISRPNPPRRAVLKLDDVAFLMFLDAHTAPLFSVASKVA
jgi:hypothetical protein